MNTIQSQFREILKQYNKDDFTIYPTGGGEVALYTSGKVAIVWTDGRYPEIGKGYSINQICIESITVLHGAVVLEVEGEIIALQKGDKIDVLPLQKYSISGKSVCRVDISPEWDSSQNSFVI